MARQPRGASRNWDAPPAGPVIVGHYDSDGDCAFLDTNGYADMPGTYLSFQLFLAGEWIEVDSAPNSSAFTGSCVFGNEGGGTWRFAVLTVADSDLVAASDGFEMPGL